MSTPFRVVIIDDDPAILRLLSMSWAGRDGGHSVLDRRGEVFLPPRNPPQLPLA